MPRLRFRVALVLLAGVLSLALFFSYSPDDDPNSSQFSSYSWSSERESAFEQQRSYMIPSAQGDIHIADSGSTACFTNAPGPRIQPFFAYDRNLYDQPKMDFVKEMMVHAWKNYERFAWGADELHPVSKRPKNWYGNFSLMSTPVDALDTLFIMGLSEEYSRAKSLVLRKLDFSKIDAEVSFFETTIRVLGGLLSAYELDGDMKLVKKAEELAKRLLPAFETQTGIPYNQINLKTGLFSKDSYVDMKKTSQIAEAGTLQLEFQYLSDITGNPVYAEKALFAMEQILATKKPVKGLYPRDIFVEDLEFADEIYEIGAGADSFYEYLLKLWLSTGDDRYWEVYYESAQAMRDKMARISDDGKYVYIPGTTRYSYGTQETWYRDNTFHHLTCFAGGMFALGALARRTGNWTDHLSLGKRITESCFEAYNRTRTGLGPELADVSGGFTYASMWIMRPEAIESIFYMWRFTHDPIYREMGWTIAKSINKWSRVPHGFTGIEHVDSFRPGYHPDTGEKLDPNDPPPAADPYAYHPNMYAEEVRVAPSADYPYADAVFRNDVQESFFLAETLKYLYLLFAGDDVIPLEDFVFNTEAHPISVRGRGRRRDASKWVPLPVPDAYVEERDWTDAEVVHRNLGGGDVSWLRRFWRVKDAYGGTKSGSRRRVKFRVTPGTSRNYTMAETQKRDEAVEKLQSIERSKMEESYRKWEEDQRRKKSKLFGKPKEKLDSSGLNQEKGELQDPREDYKYRPGSYNDPKNVRPMRPDGPAGSGKPADVYYGNNHNAGENADGSSSPALSDEQPPAEDNVKIKFEVPQKLSTPPSMSKSGKESGKAAQPADEDVDHSPAAAAAFNSADDDDENTVSGVAHVGKGKGNGSSSEHELSPAGQAAMAAGDSKKKEELNSNGLPAGLVNGKGKEGGIVGRR
ncbi:glycoside hydrolase [Cladochytrium replicatum]|nr:glycoside hydrolase [Cladochytrium replicatum]